MTNEDFKEFIKTLGPSIKHILDDREITILFRRLGISGEEPETLKQVGERLGVTRERVRQLQNIALSKLRRAWPHKAESNINVL